MPKDVNKAYSLYRKAASQGNAYGVNNQAYMLMHRIGHKRDLVKALHLIKWLKEKAPGNLKRCDRNDIGNNSACINQSVVPLNGDSLNLSMQFSEDFHS